VIACNTLHLFLSKEKIPQLVNLIKLAKKQLPKNAKPLVLASRTTAKEKLYDKLLGIKCEYWQPEQSQAIINDILQGKKADLSWIVGLAKTRTVILGCTEYSLAMENYPLIPNLIDPLKLAAQKFFEIFNKA
jgi:aspartate/glutamate racemase